MSEASGELMVTSILLVAGGDRPVCPLSLWARRVAPPGRAPPPFRAFGGAPRRRDPLPYCFSPGVLLRFPYRAATALIPVWILPG